MFGNNRFDLLKAGESAQKSFFQKNQYLFELSCGIELALFIL